MIIHNWKNKELNRLLMEKFGLLKEESPGSCPPGKAWVETKIGKYECVDINKEGLEEAEAAPLQAAMERCGSQAKNQQEYDECMKGATPSGRPRQPSVVDKFDEGKGHPGEPLEAKDHPGECADVHPDLGHEEWASKKLKETIFMKRITIKE
jgi:hypothetical protein